jgi:hypothetical protein
VEHLELVELRPDRLGALEVEHRGEPVAVELVDGPRDPERAARRALHPTEERHLRERLVERAPPVDRGEVLAGLVRVMLRAAREHGEEAGGEPARSRARQVDVPLAVAGEEARGRAGAGLPESRDRVVVTVEDAQAEQPTRSPTPSAARPRRPASAPR